MLATFQPALLLAALCILTAVDGNQHHGGRHLNVNDRDSSHFRRLVRRGGSADSSTAKNAWSLASSSGYSATTAADIWKSASSSSTSWSSSKEASSTSSAYSTSSTAESATSKSASFFTPSTTSTSVSLTTSSISSTTSTVSASSTSTSSSSSTSLLSSTSSTSSSSSSSSSISVTSATYTSIAPCATGKCDAQCATGSIKDPNTGNCIDISSDINNCGGIGLACTTQDQLGQTTCYQGVCRDCGLGAMGYWDSLFNQCSALQDDFCYTLYDPTASALKGIFEKCNILDWFTGFVKENGLDTMDTSSTTFTHQFAATLKDGYTFDCTPAAECVIDTPVSPYTPTGTKDLYYRQDQVGAYLILEALSNYNNIAWNLIGNANTALQHVDNLMDNIVNGFGLSKQAADNSMDPVQLTSTIMNGVLGIMMLVAPETMPLDMLLMIGNSGFMTWYNQQTKNDPMAPEPDLNAASYRATLDPIIDHYTTQQNTVVSSRFQDYESIYDLVSKPGMVDSLIHAFPSYASVHTMVAYLMANLLTDIFRDRKIFFTTKDYGDAASCQTALKGTAASANSATCIDSRLYYATYWEQTFWPISDLDGCPAAAIYDASIGVGLTSDQLDSIATGEEYGFSLDVLFNAALSCSTNKTVNPWGGFPLSSDPKDFPQPIGFTGRLATDTCVVNIPVCDVDDQQLKQYCKDSNAPVDCDTLEGISYYCANQMGSTSGSYNTCSGPLWPQGYKFCSEAYHEAQARPSCPVPMGYPWKRNAHLQKRVCNFSGASGAYGAASCAQSTCTSDYIHYDNLFSDYDCDASTTNFNPVAAARGGS